MSELQNHFHININKGLANPAYVYKGKKYRITILSDVLIRLEYNEDGIFNDYPTLLVQNRKFKTAPNIKVKEDKNYLNISNSYFMLEYTKEKHFSANKLIADSNLRVSLVDLKDKIWYYNHPEARNYLGSTFSFDDPSFNPKKLNNGLYSGDGFATINDSNTPVFVKDGSVKKNPSNGIDIYLFIYNKDFGKCLQSYYELTGYPNLPPRYCLGITWNKNEDYDEEDIKNLVNGFKKSKVPLSSIMLSSFKQTPKQKELISHYEFDLTKYNNPKEFVKYLHSNNIYLGLELITEEGINPKDIVYNDFKTLLKLDKDQIIPFNIYSSDQINLFYEKIVNSLINIGVDYFWLNDKQKNIYKNFIIAHYTYENFKQSKRNRGLVYSRNSGIATHRYPVMYSGETKVSWSTLNYLPYYNLTNSNVGLSWWSHDIGGYHGGIEDAELYTRYVELGVFSPIFRFSSRSGRYYKREPWNWDVKTEKIVEYYTQLRHALIPYIYSEGYKYSKIGTPLITPLYYRKPSLYDELDYKNEYYFGSNLLVSPITKPKDSLMDRVVHKTYVPEGTWYDFKTGKKFPGDKRYVMFFTDDDYPVFAKSGSIIPMGILDENNLNDVKPPKNMEVQVFPGASSSYNLFEDDGVSSLYKEGYYVLTNINYNYRKNNYTLIIRPTEGKTGIIPELRNYTIRFRNTKNPENVKVNIAELEVKYETYTDENDFYVIVNNVPTNKQLTINCAGKAIEIDAIRLINDDIDEILSDLKIPTDLKVLIANIIFSDTSISKKRIEIRKLRRKGLNNLFIKMFIKLLEYINEI